MDTNIDCRELVNAIGDAVIVANAGGKIALWNPGAERLFGFSEHEALGQSLDLIVPDRLRKRHWDGYDKCMATGVTKYGHELLRVPAVRKDGSGLSIAFTVALLFDENHAVSAIVSVIRDDTQRFNDERALRKRLAEVEAGTPAANP